MQAMQQEPEILVVPSWNDPSHGMINESTWINV
jgi:hypothetical protein